MIPAIDVGHVAEAQHEKKETSVSGDTTGMSHFLVPGEIDTSHGLILYLENISVSFDGFRALNDLSLAIHTDELRCIIGPNGAGKTTMMDVITGKTRPSAGRAFLGQTLDLTRLDEPAIAEAGVGRKFQKPTVFEQHSVWENLELAYAGEKGDKRWFRALWASLTPAIRRRIEEVLALTHLEHQAHVQAGQLSHGQKQRLEIGMLLMQQPQLLLLDEPAAGMTDEETAQLADLLNRLRGHCSMMVVEHDMAFVAALSGDTGLVTVMAEGRVLAEGTLDVVQRDERVIESYLGR
ncbi:Lipopolysaccharide export system ATP-binding protein LptB [Pandoraea iniqua]|uniref:urea ABC transporter ATP-binding protein UrtD n=1 Tax=Pandoraea iniqua TaxID=2508288 RepID=UPI001241A731|nr:Lipopolysaccharide export system ATP-binding protein LptB [Pandoraea iniqua]